MSNQDMEIFNSIAANNSWGDAESISGPGSTLAITAHLRRYLASAMKQLDIRSMVDAPCGDMNWMRHIDYPFDYFIGVDVVPQIVAKLNTEKFPPNYHFQVGNIVTDILPRADAVFCRDCLVHLPLEAIDKAVDLFRKAGFKYLITTTFPTYKHGNTQINPGEWRILNFEAPPFNWGPPVHMVSEYTGYPEPYHDKSVGIWKL